MDPNRGLPGETPLDDISGLRLRYVHTRAQLYGAEEENVAEVIAKYLSKRPNRREAPFTHEWMLGLHREMFGKVWIWAGRVRTTSETRPGVPPRMIGTELHRLMGDIEWWQEHGGDTVEQAAMLHHRAVWIHPFENGNGRWARLVSQIWQYQQTGALTMWPNQDISQGISVIRDTYIDALREADNGNLGPLIDLHRQLTVDL